MGAARLCVGLQAILVMSLLLPPPFLPCVLAGAGPGGELVAGEEKHQGRVFASGISTRSLRILSQNPGPGGEHHPPISSGRGNNG
ncbi:Os02g0212500 [Oryza sativa Japonica Group]|uniref:Os02g0212500 protein n=2 Tax=Oryza sativa subsp. japonica TaxID=39947 RepID=Q0E2U9_ORYSJ|nr:uncharacterized protein LOC4328706 [Oryza sativa Japonica Group]KAB8086434.1 hypothetical protein EE612_009717 [Oryza sativa]EAZ22210.1 hypothetical protein OsJ_05870 [Oryza sativa Japonica Group]KAF2943734.1 hypothetical protein DAI22_02g086700 [Oryza sativa Japonica Group]BAD25116.1 unknown protein [Oryza sativa Japonica Group]BAF08189.1 Os02g0212500 [Oryza sativa Japonica Group]|eukprot:NP_001046275.1 Os02g0212500 [Oryza sativa Japonica Group]